MNNRFAKYLMSALMLCFFAGGEGFAGTFSMGLSAGMSDDSGTMGRIVRDINSDMRAAEISSPGTSVDELENWYMPVASVNFSYTYNLMILQLSWEYSRYIWLKPEGSIDTPANPKNSITLDYTRFTFPFSAGIQLPLDRRSRLYFAGGINFTYFILDVDQKNPGSISAFPGGSATFASYLAGFHFKAGAEARLSRNYGLVVEFTRYMGVQSSVESEDKTAEIDLCMDGFQVTAGLTYTADFMR